MGRLVLRRIGLILLAVLTAANASASCESYLRKSFDLDRFVEAKRIYRSRLGAGTGVEEKGKALTREEQLALIEAVSEGKDWDLFDFEHQLIAAENPEKLASKIAYALDTYDLNVSRSPFELSRLIERLYKLSNPGSDSVLAWVISDRRNGLDKIVRARVERELATNDLEGALSELGLLRKNSTIEKFRSWRRKHSAWEDAAILLAVNSLIYAKFGPFLSMSTLNMLNAKSLSAATIAEIKKNGLAAVLPKIRKKWRLAAGIQLSTRAIGRVMVGVYSVMLGYFAVANFPMIRSVVGSALVTKEAVAAEQAKSTADQIRERKYKMWKEGYEEVIERQLDTIHNAQDRALVREQWDIINSIPDEGLRVVPN